MPDKITVEKIHYWSYGPCGDAGQVIIKKNFKSVAYLNPFYTEQQNEVVL